MNGDSASFYACQKGLKRRITVSHIKLNQIAELRVLRIYDFLSIASSNRLFVCNIIVVIHGCIAPSHRLRKVTYPKIWRASALSFGNGTKLSRSVCAKDSCRSSLATSSKAEALEGAQPPARGQDLCCAARIATISSIASACILNAVPPPQPYRRDNPFDLGSR